MTTARPSYDYSPRRLWGSVEEVKEYAESVATIDPVGARGLPISGDDVARIKAGVR